MENEFFIGWDAESGAESRGLVARGAKAFIFLGVVAALVVGLAQRPFAKSNFEFGVERTYEGRIEHIPYPTLVLARPSPADAGSAADGVDESRWLLTVFGKFGADEHTLPVDGHNVRVTGSLIYRDRTTMLEIQPGSIEDLGLAARAAQPTEAPVRVTLRGEIVDSKCFLGVMKPGNLKPHRACAARCISGGVPPVLLVRNDEGEATYYLLTDEKGAAVNERVLHLVAEQIEVTGDLTRLGGTLLLRSNPETYTRVE